MERAALLSVSSALPKAFIQSRSGYISVSCSLLTTSRASTYLLISSAPSRALKIFFSPSKKKGMVTMPIVSNPRSCAMRATTGPAPVPVPPLPAVMNTILVSSSKRRAISSALSSAACRASSGLLPAPSPLVMFGPMSSRFGTTELLRACLSVLQTTNDTFRIPCSYMWFTALSPPPPTPITLIITSSRFSSTKLEFLSISSIVIMIQLVW